MNRYRVFDQCPLGREIALRDSAGRFYVARTSFGVPTVGTELEGALPQLRLHSLLTAPDGRKYRVTFELVDCSLQKSFDRLHP